MSKDDDERAKRLAEALRQNLRRRKAQARGEGEKAVESNARHSGESRNPGTPSD